MNNVEKVITFKKSMQLAEKPLNLLIYKKIMIKYSKFIYRVTPTSFEKIHYKNYKGNESFENMK